MCDNNERAPLLPINRVQQQGRKHQAMGFNPDFQAACLKGFPASYPSQFQYHMAATMAAFTCASSPASSQNYTGCTFSYFSSAMPQLQPQKKRRAHIIESDDED